MCVVLVLASARALAGHETTAFDRRLFQAPLSVAQDVAHSRLVRTNRYPPESILNFSIYPAVSVVGSQNERHRRYKTKQEAPAIARH